MKQWCTEIQAIDPTTGQMKKWGGPDVPGINIQDAQQYCRDNLGYCRVIGELVADVPCKRGSFDPDFKNKIDYETINLN